MKRGSDPGFDDDRFDDFDGNKGRPVLITAAEPSYEEQHRARVRKYLTLMAFRVPALIFAASVPLPWMAVLIAHDRPPRRANEPRRFDNERRRTPLFPTAERPALEARRHPLDHQGPGGDTGSA